MEGALRFGAKVGYAPGNGATVCISEPLGSTKRKDGALDGLLTHIRFFILLATARRRKKKISAAANKSTTARTIPTIAPVGVEDEEAADDGEFLSPLLMSTETEGVGAGATAGVAETEAEELVVVLSVTGGAMGTGSNEEVDVTTGVEAVMNTVTVGVTAGVAMLSVVPTGAVWMTVSVTGPVRIPGSPAA